MMLKHRKNRGVEALKKRYGIYFVTPWCIGLALFFIFPLIQSIYYAFADVFLTAKGLDISFTGWSNFKYMFTEDPVFTNNIAASMGSFAYSFPLIIVLSLVIAVILSREFKGRTFFRALYFLPVIIATGIVTKLILKMSVPDIQQMGASAEITGNMIRVDDMLDWLGLPEKIGSFLSSAVNNIMDLLWNCGIQIVLIIAGIQSIPDQLYEVATVEGASAWEAFWFVTLPMLLRVILLVSIYTIIEIMTSANNLVMEEAYTFLESQRYGFGNAALWSYFLLIGLVLSVVLFAYAKANKKWGDQ